jgi:hypothetical protein
MRFFDGLNEYENKELDAGNLKIRSSRAELLIALNPILTDQIQSKYVEYPMDINRRTLIAAGGHYSVTPSVIVLRDYLLRELSNKRSIREINEDALVHLLRLTKHLKECRQKLIQRSIKSAVQTAINLGLITHHERCIGAEGQWKYIFYLNPDFE